MSGDVKTEAEKTAADAADPRTPADQAGVPAPAPAPAPDAATATGPHTSTDPVATASGTAGAKPSTGRRELTTAVLVAIAGGILAWAAAGRVWATGTAGHVPDTLAVSATGNDLSAAVTALGLTALAGALALLATRRLARRLVGALLIAVGAGVAAGAVSARGAGHAAHVLADQAAAKHFATGTVTAHTASWWLLAVAGGVLIALAGLAAVLRGAAWPGMSSRYENAAAKGSPAARADAGTAKDLWDALDRGEDPTEAATGTPGTPGTDH